MSDGPHRNFGEAIAVTELGSGRYRGTFTREWFGPPGPNGGFVAALMLRAIRDELDDEARLPRSLTLHYLRPPAEGEAVVEVTVERSGGSASTCSARIIQDDRTMTLGLCVLSYDYEPALSWEPVAPAAPAPEEIEPLPLAEETPPIFRQLDARPVFGSRPFSGGEEAIAGGWLRAHGDEHLTPELIALFTDAWWPAPFSVMTTFAPAPTLELTIHFRAKPPPDDPFALARFRAEAAIDGLFDELGEVWDRSGRLLAQSSQIALLRPLKQ